MSSSPTCKASIAERYESTLALTLTGFEASLDRYMPAGPYRDFYLWAISPQNPQREAFLQIIGASQLVKLTITLLDGLVDDASWPRLADHSVVMNVYQLYEIVSDNLAIGLAGQRKGDLMAGLRRDLLRAFNDAMVARLRGAPKPAAQLLASWQPGARCISIFDQSLNGYKQRVSAEAYLSLQADVGLDDLEYSVWPVLVANIESCADLAQSMNGYLSSHLLREGLISRYQAVNGLLEMRALTLPQLADVGAEAILVVPTLAYYVAVLGEAIRPLEHFQLVIQNGSLARALYDAALLVRLLNDLGTQLVTQTPVDRAALVQALTLRHWEDSETTPTIADLLSGSSDRSGLFTRLHKDIAYGEFNVALYGISDMTPRPEALQVFENNLAYFAQRYAQHQASLRDASAALSDCLGDNTLSTLILRFVRFHEQLYANPYHVDVGEYAV
jgi:hypothetical protein